MLRGARIASARCALLHFKFLGDFNRRVNEEMARRAYFMNGAEYELYSKLIRRQTGIDFSCPFSTRYNGTQQLLELGLLKELCQHRAFYDGHRSFTPSSTSSSRPLHCNEGVPDNVAAASAN